MWNVVRECQLVDCGLQKSNWRPGFAHSFSSLDLIVKIISKKTTVIETKISILYYIYPVEQSSPLGQRKGNFN